ncbi:hypothetical protein IFT64_10725 [Oxalobacteraceae sp. CFBP 8753]|nr:hypothetical protein [Oxalobacteraceae sp. CFBP 8753]
MPKTPSRALEGVVCAAGTCAEGETDGVVEAGTDGLAADATGAEETEPLDWSAGGVTLVVGMTCAGTILAESPLSTVGAVTVATGAPMVDTVIAAVAESVSTPPPPHAASDVQSSVETTLTVTVRENSVIWVSSISGSIGCGIRLFALSLSDDANITLGKAIPHGKISFYRKLLGICNRRLPVLLWALKKYYRMM